LALLTLPVVVVSVEEGLARIPSSLREGSLALGATHDEALWTLLLPAARPALLTGLILAVARAAGAVAPLMLVGVVKLAPALPVDSVFPYLHPSREFMHLGFTIYDAALASADAIRGVPRAYACAGLLVGVVLVLNLTAILLRNRLRDRYRALET
jgi:phosphate transport system permease protein